MKRKIFDLGKRIRHFRKSHGYSILDLKNILANNGYPVSEKTIYKWENNETCPEIKVLKILAIIFDVSLSTFFDENISRQALNDSELNFITTLRANADFRKIILLITKKEKEVFRHANRTRCEA